MKERNVRGNRIYYTILLMGGAVRTLLTLAVAGTT